ncbi:MAG: hypothetical protein NWQ16_00005, partial [Akkermansiaceae bacterium]|nr:hypothetical protein [Akkermansiaceae bacterium]
VLGMTLAYLHKTTQAPVIDDEIVKQEISEVIIVAEESAATETSDESPDGSAQVTNITEAPAPAPSAAPKPTSKFLSLSPDQIADIRQLDPGTLIELTGTLRDVIYIKPKETLVLDFEGTKGAAPIRGIIFKKGFKGPFSIASLKPYIGKQIIVRGISLTNKTKKSRDVSVRRFEDITLVQTPEEKPPESIAKAESEAAPDNPKLSPEDRETIEGLDNGTEVTLSGLFRSTRFSNTGKSLYLEFASQDRASVRGVIHQSDYPGTYTKEAFDELVGKTVTITGTVFKDNFNNPALVKVRSWDDIVKAP